MAQSSKQTSNQSIGSLPMAIALDKSGSTYGNTLQTEVQAVQDICRLRQPTNKSPIRLLPWCGEALDTIDLPDNVGAMMRLVGGGSTDPSVLYESEACLNVLKQCGVWFLLTDGEIYDSLVEKFAMKTAQVGLHNKPCIIIVFDDVSRGRPATRNISVGIAAFAVVPDCLFLFHDIPTGHVRVMQAKGRFQALLPITSHERAQPVITKYTAWSELPRISYEDLSRIQLSEGRELDVDELQLQGGTVVKLTDVLSGKADPETVEQIMKNDDDLKSIVLASMTRGTGKDVEAWLQAQQKPLPERTRHPKDFDGETQKAVDRLLAALGKGSSEAELDGLRSRVRLAHERNLQTFFGIVRDEGAEEYPIRVHNQRMRNGVAMNQFKRKNVWAAQHQMCNNINSRDVYEHRLATERDNLEGPNGLGPVCLPGFRRRKPGNEFRGRCMLCHSTSVLTLLLKSPPKVATQNFPREASYAKIAFPLAMGNWAEMDLLSFFVCCDACAFYIQCAGASPYSETIVGALCLVCVGDNQAAWMEAIDQAVRGRFDISDLLAICMAMIDKKLVENEGRDASPVDKSLFRDCAQWTLRNLAQITEVPSTLSPAFGNGKDAATTTTLYAILATEHFANPGHIENVDLLLLRYPISGFMSLLRLLSLLYVQPEQVQNLLFQRVLFHIMEQYITKRLSGSLQLPVGQILGLGGSNDTGNASGSINQDGRVSIAFSELTSYDLMDDESLEILRSQVEFNGIETQSGPALAVFLHHLLRYGQVYPTPMACFNALKVSTTMKKVILTPLAISPGLASDMISQL